MRDGQRLEITHVHADLPPELWAFIKKNKFFGMIIPKEYGGLGFPHWPTTR